ncbi:MAG: NADH-quinone oxidoreductase subunit H, partial [Polyangiaceae bacterium]|nr:NADH-quinone oxidoreductase subunit H [Polyangiaceae bacterium]
MSAVTIVIALVKAAFVVLFVLTVGGVLTWADRRQGAMIQDRVGPNRAVVFIPAKLALLLSVVPAVAVAGIFLWFVYGHKVQGAERTAYAIGYSHLAILLLWATGLGIAARIRHRGPRSAFDALIAAAGDPRRFLYVGLSVHALALAAQLMLRGTDIGRLLREFGLGSGPALAAFAVLGGAAYAAACVRRERRVGIRVIGLLHLLADGLKTLFKEDLVPPHADRLLHGLAPIIAFFPGLVVLAVVPFGDKLCLAMDGESISGIVESVSRSGSCEHALTLQVLDLDIGILFAFAVMGTGVVGAALAGWSSDNKFSLLGGLRAAGQMVSYEVTLGLTVIGALMVYGTLKVDQMIEWQAAHAWGIFVQPLAFVLFFTAAVAETKRIPFDLPEGESEIVAGYFTEYSGLKFAMFFVGEYVGIVASAALMAALFFGGWDVPFLDRDGLRIVFGDSVVFTQALQHGWIVLFGVLAFTAKVLVLSWLQLTVRWTLPRFRYDQLMALG